MMNGRRKSDRPVVAAKLANKAEVTANDAGALVAEQVERRGLAKGKTPRQNTDRAQYRDRSVSSASEPVRHVIAEDHHEFLPLPSSELR